MVGHLDLHDPAEGIHKLAPGVLVQRVNALGRRHRAAEHDGCGQVGAGERHLQFGFEDGHGCGAGDVWRLRRMACLFFTISMKAVNSIDRKSVV